MPVPAVRNAWEKSETTQTPELGHVHKFRSIFVQNRFLEAAFSLASGNANVQGDNK